MLNMNQYRFQKMIAVGGPSGGGKSVLIEYIEARLRETESVLGTTTRNPRPGEIDGSDYFFWTLDAFQKGVANNEFLEHTAYCNHLYGKRWSSVEKVIRSGKIPILNATLSGVEAARKEFPNSLTFFVTTRTKEQLVARLKKRGFSNEEIARRMETTKIELAHAPLICDIHLFAPDNSVDVVGAQMVSIIKGYLEGWTGPFPL